MRRGLLLADARTRVLAAGTCNARVPLLLTSPAGPSWLDSFRYRSTTRRQPSALRPTEVENRSGGEKRARFILPFGFAYFPLRGNQRVRATHPQE